MAEDASGGKWLLLDAAGPFHAIGILSGDRWLAWRTSPEPFLEQCAPRVKEVLRECGTDLPGLSGVLCAAGPGSTLGLRLAALFARTLLSLPQLAHWKARQYNNLAVAAASLLGQSPPLPLSVLAPLRKGLWFRYTLTGTRPWDGQTDTVATDLPEQPDGIPFSLGNPRRIGPPGRDFPLDRLPELLAAYPALSHAVAEPRPLQVENPDFARWVPRRHGAP